MEPKDYDEFPTNRWNILLYDEDLNPVVERTYHGPGLWYREHQKMRKSDGEYQDGELMWVHEGHGFFYEYQVMVLAEGIVLVRTGLTDNRRPHL